LRRQSPDPSPYEKWTRLAPSSEGAFRRFRDSSNLEGGRHDLAGRLLVPLPDQVVRHPVAGGVPPCPGPPGRGGRCDFLVVRLGGGHEALALLGESFGGHVRHGSRVPAGVAPWESKGEPGCCTGSTPPEAVGSA